MVRSLWFNEAYPGHGGGVVGRCTKLSSNTESDRPKSIIQLVAVLLQNVLQQNMNVMGPQKWI